MIPKNYSGKIAEKLLSLHIPEISEPYPIITHWLNIHTPSFKGNYITCKMHRHTYFELHIVLNGSAEYGFSANSTVYVPSGSALLIPPGIKHIVQNHSEDVFKFSVTFSPESDSKLYHAIFKDNYILFPVDNKIIRAIESIFAEKEKNSAFSDIIIKGRLIEIYSALPGASQIPSETKPVHASDIRLENALRYIEDNISANLTCGEIASHCGISTKQLSRIFEKHIGKPPLEYIHSEKFRTAKNLLTGSDLSIREISEKLGFANEYYFNTFFTRQCGIPPGHFRKNKTENY